MIRFKKKTSEGFIPSYRLENTCGMNLQIPDSLLIHAGGTRHISLQIQAQLELGTFGLIKEQLILASKGISVTGILCEQVIYDVEVVIHNYSHIPYAFARGDVIAYLIIMPYNRCRIEEIV